MDNPSGQTPPPSQQLFERITGYWVSQVIGAVARLGVADKLAAGARASDELARELDANPDGLYRLLRGGVTAGLFEESAPRTFSLTPMGACLRSNVPGSMRDMSIALCDRSHWLPWGRLHEAARTGHSTSRAALGIDIWEHFAKHPEEATHFARAMGDLSGLVATELPRLHDFSSYARVADIGGSQGVLLASVLRANPSVRGILFDLPHVIDGARARLQAEGLADRVELVGGSFFEPGVPAAEAYLLKHILHDWDDASSTRILQQLHRAAPSGAKLFLLEMVMPGDRNPTPTALMDLNMLVLVDGRERTAQEFKALLDGASWEMERVTPSQMGISLIEARRR
ncbi:methyltransferase [Hyalangium rubrum]|uniref:Methyltransferase n=1 Tax=Hyalangium rubrum TaxID=3103134 RepID=A0ABU5H268_9BACT|nr:methyltransferase [Hyalangium sp. s54d21]MDY7227197.1 methyltransferase [Hyalangium sp. s54d21]